MERLAHKIRFFRTQKNWTQHDLAERLSVSRSVVAKWENTNAVPDALHLIKLCNLFDTSADFLLGSGNSYTGLLQDAIPLYEIEANQKFMDELADIIDLILVNPTLKYSLIQLSELSLQKQHSLLKILAELIKEYEKI